jgi:hypothetical protein
MASCVEEKISEKINFYLNIFNQNDCNLPTTDQVNMGVVFFESLTIFTSIRGYGLFFWRPVPLEVKLTEHNLIDDSAITSENAPSVSIAHCNTCLAQSLRISSLQPTGLFSLKLIFSKLMPVDSTPAFYTPS